MNSRPSVVLITGATSGLGRASAEWIAQEPSIPRW
jgi:NADP-dependent 3-hydroxy acid dehydrogenase YdfG